jgi:hypothetical protein
MPSRADHSIEKVEEGGAFFAKRLSQENRGNGKQMFSQQAQKGMASVVPCDDSEETVSPSTASLRLFLLEPETASPNFNGCSPFTGPDVVPVTSPEVAPTYVHDNTSALPRATDGWEVSTHNILLRPKQRPDVGKTVQRFSKKQKRLTTGSQFSDDHIGKLLGQLSGNPFGHEPRGPDASRATAGAVDERVSTFDRIPSLFSWSTLLFGSSDVANMSDCDLISPRLTFDAIVSPKRTLQSAQAARCSNSGVPIRSMFTLDRPLTHPELDRVGERHMNKVDDKEVAMGPMPDFPKKAKKESGGEPVYASSDGSSTGSPPDAYSSEAPSISPTLKETRRHRVRRESCPAIMMSPPKLGRIRRELTMRPVSLGACADSLLMTRRRQTAASSEPMESSNRPEDVIPEILTSGEGNCAALAEEREPHVPLGLCADSALMRRRSKEALAR